MARNRKRERYIGVTKTKQQDVLFFIGIGLGMSTTLITF